MTNFEPTTLKALYLAAWELLSKDLPGRTTHPGEDHSSQDIPWKRTLIAEELRA